MRRTHLSPLLLVLAAASAGSALARPVPLEPTAARNVPVPLQPAASIMYETHYFGGTTWAADSLRWEAVLDSVWTFETGVGPMEGWTGIDLTVTAPEQRFRRLSASAFSGTPVVGSPAGLGGDYSFWAGLLENEADSLCWAGGQGYGNTWLICITKEFPYDDSGCLRLSYSFYNESEPGYDYTYVFIDTTGASSIYESATATFYTGTVDGTAGATLDLQEGTTLRSDAGPVRIRFCFQSDGAYSDEDGLNPTARGGFAVDDIVVSTASCGGSLADTSDFETDADGWQVEEPSANFTAGDFSRIAAVADLPPLPGGLQCDLGDSVLVLFDPIGPAPHPMFQDNLAASPWIDLRRAGVTGYSNKFIDIGGYRHLPYSNRVFYTVEAQWYPDTCDVTGLVRRSDWKSDPSFFFVETPTCDPHRIDVSPIIPPYAEQVRIGLRVVNLCRFFTFLCDGESNTSPWFDDVRLAISTLENLQSAIDASAEGDTVWIPPGTYRNEGNVDLDFGGKNIVLKSEAGPEATIIDGRGLDRLFLFHSGETSSSVVEGFTIRGGRKSVNSTLQNGGCVLITGSSSPTFRDCRISGLGATGGGVYADASSSPSFLGCTFSNCGADLGGGAAVTAATFEDCTFLDNNADQDGGGLHAQTATVSGCAFDGNTADGTGGGAYFGAPSLVENSSFTGNEAGEGGGLRLAGGLVLGSTISGNHALADGGGVMLLSGTDGQEEVRGRLEYCDVTDNSADGAGGGIFQYGWTSVTGGTVAGNTALHGGGIAGVGWFPAPEPPPGGDPPGLAELSGVVLTGNAAEQGGGLHINDHDFVGWDTGMILTSCTVSGNSADTGGGIYVSPDAQIGDGYRTRVDGEQTILFGNCADLLGNEVAFTDTAGLATFTCSNLDTLGIEGPGTFVLDGPQVFEYPEFCSPVPCYLAPNAAGTYQLAASSPDLPPHNACGVLIGALGVGCQIVDAPPREEEAPPVATPALAVGQNPFRGSLSIRYEAPEGTQPVLRIYDVRGALVQDLPLAGPRGTATWDGRGRSGESAPAGVYFLQLVAGSERRSLRVVRMQ